MLKVLYSYFTANKKHCLLQHKKWTLRISQIIDGRVIFTLPLFTRVIQKVATETAKAAIEIDKLAVLMFI